MGKVLKIVLGSVVGIILVCAVCGGILWGQRNTAVDLEERINAQYVTNQSNYDNMWKKFKELVQVTDIQANQMKDVYEGLITGRYKDPNLLFKMVQEQNPQLNIEVYANIQREISSGRNSFTNDQKQIADIIREYNSYVRKNIIMTAITNCQVKDASEFIVTSEQTQNAFKNRKDGETLLK